MADIPATPFEILTQIGIDDLLSALGLDSIRFGREVLKLLCRGPAQRFAHQIVAYDEIVGVEGLQAGHAWLLEQFVKDVEIRGQEHIPRSGPLLVVANHPGQSDGSALFVSIPRTDLRVVSARHLVMRTLPHTSRYLFFIADTASERLGLIRAVTRHLRSGGAVVIFPGGGIEPDPAALPGAVEALAHWSPSMDLFARLVSDLTIVPAVASGVLSRRALRHPLTYLRRDRQERRRLATILQILVPAYHDVTVRITFGRPIRTAGLECDKAGISTTVRAEIRRLIEECRT
jgi:1-acyl-sn-glycerol-3-phosphate acyltransferase